MLSLPRELLQPICDQLPRQDKARLRLACRELKSILDPAVFDTLTLTVSNKELLKSLATGDSLIKNFVQTLNVRHVSSISSALHGKEPAKATKRYLLQAIQSLQLLRTVNWTLNDHDANWFTQNTIFQALTSLEHLKEFSLAVLSPFFSRPEHLPQSLSSISMTASLHVFERLAAFLPEFVAQNTGLENLCLKTIGFYPGAETQPSEFSTFVQQVSRFPSITKLRLSGWNISTDTQVIHPCFHSLSTLHVSGVHSEFWRSLQLANIQIRDLRNTDINMPLLQYIASYSGLANLSLSDLYSETLPEIDGIGAFFYEVVIPKHCTSLEELHICTWHHRQWCFNEAYSNSISQCMGLRGLSISLDDSLHGMCEVTTRLLQSIRPSYPSLVDLKITAYSLPGMDGQKQYSWKHPEQPAETTLAEVQNAILTFGLTGPDCCNPHLRIHLLRMNSGYYYPEYRFRGQGDIAVNFCRYDPPSPSPVDYRHNTQRGLWRRSQAVASRYFDIFKRAFEGS